MEGMAVRRLLPAVAALLAAAVLAGCAGPSGGWERLPPAGTPSPSPAAPEPGLSYVPNLWLKDAPHPSWTAVSGGSEPFMLADREGQYLWIGDTSGGYFSVDNGTTWSRMGSYTGNAQVAFRDGWVFAQDESGRLYAAVLHDNRVDVLRSSNGGDSWSQVTYAVGVSGPADRPWIAARGNDVAMVYFDAPAVITGRPRGSAPRFSDHETEPRG